MMKGSKDMHPISLLIESGSPYRVLIFPQIRDVYAQIYIVLDIIFMLTIEPFYL
jgi:hypothetical protein